MSRSTGTSSRPGTMRIFPAIPMASWDMGLAERPRLQAAGFFFPGLAATRSSRPGPIVLADALQCGAFLELMRGMGEWPGRAGFAT